MDNYASKSELASLRSRDEKHEWQRIPDEHLVQCYCSPTYFDTAGLIFHLPAFIRAELSGSHNHGFFDQLIDDGFVSASPNFRHLLTATQRGAILQVLQFLLRCPDYDDSAEDIHAAIGRYRGTSDVAEQ